MYNKELDNLSSKTSFDQNILNQIQQENEMLKQNNEMLRADNNRLRGKNIEVITEKHNLKVKTQQLLSENTNLKALIRKLQNQNSLQTAQINMLVQGNQVMLNDIQQQKYYNDTRKQHISGIQKQLERVNEENKDLRDEINVFKNKKTEEVGAQTDFEEKKEEEKKNNHKLCIIWKALRYTQQCALNTRKGRKAKMGGAAMNIHLNVPPIITQQIIIRMATIKMVICGKKDINKTQSLNTATKTLLTINKIC